MVLFNTAGTYVQIVIMLLIALAIVGVYIFFIIKYMLSVHNEEHRRAEKSIAIAGYYSIASMILLFFIVWFGFKNNVVTLERNYYGLFAVFASLAYIPFLIIYDIKQVRWIKGLSDKEQLEYGISIKDRMPLIVVIAILSIINVALVGLCIESFIYVFQGLL